MSGVGESCTVFVKCIAGIDNLELRVPVETTISELKRSIIDKLPPSIIPRISISSAGGIDISSYSTVKNLYESTTYNHKGNDPSFLNLKLNVCLCGGKGGHGQLLKASGHAMSKKKGKNLKSNSKDLFKTLDGRRVSNIKKLKLLEEHMSTLDEAERTKIAEKKAKLQKIIDLDLEKNVKFEDTAFFDEIESQIEEIRKSMNFDKMDESDNEGSSTGGSYLTDSDSESEEEMSSSAISSTSSQLKRSKLVSMFDDEDEEESTIISKKQGKRPEE